MSDDIASSPATSPFARRLGLITALGLAGQVMFIIIWRRDYVPLGDAYFFQGAGRLLADGRGWINPAEFDYFGRIEQAADHPPMYILFLATLSWLGITGTVAQMLLTSVVFGAPLIWVCGQAGREIGGERLGLIAATTVAVIPGVWVWQGTLLSEPTAMLGLALVILTAYRFIAVPTLGRATAMGLALTLATFGRAELLMLSLIVVTPLVLRATGWSWGRRIGALCLAGAVCAASLAPWVLYNMSRFEEPVYLSAGYEITLASANCDYTYYGAGTGYWHLDCVLDIYERAGMTTDNSDQSERSALLLDETLDFMSEHRDRIPTVVVARWLRIVGLWKPIEEAVFESVMYDRELWSTRLAAAAWYPMAVAAIAGTVILRRRRISILPLVGPVVVVFITITITFAQYRYRASAEPAIALLAAVAVERLWVAWRRIVDDPDDVPLQDADSGNER